MDAGMTFELMLRGIFGAKAYGFAGFQQDGADHRRWLKKSVQRLARDVENVDAPIDRRERLIADLDAVASALSKSREPTWEMIYPLIHAIARMLGYKGLRGHRLYNITFWQTPDQHRLAGRPGGPNIDEEIRDAQNVIALRRAMVVELKQRGIDDYRVALVLNTSEHHVKELRRDLATSTE